MSIYRNGGIQYLPYSYKSSHSHESSQSHYFGVRSGHQPKMFTAFNSFGSIQNSGATAGDLKILPTATSMKSIPDTLADSQSKLETFKKIMLTSASKRWTEKDILSNWSDLSQLLKSGFQGSKQQIEKCLTFHKTPQKEKRSKSQQCRRPINTGTTRQMTEVKQEPKLQRFNSYNYQKSAFQKHHVAEQKAKSVEGRHKKQHQQQKPSQSKQQELFQLCHDIESILGAGEKRLAV